MQTIQEGRHDITTQVGVVCSTATGPGGLRLARLLGLPRSGCERAELRIIETDPDDPASSTVWTRTLGRQVWKSTVSVTDAGDVVERVGPLSVRFTVDLASEGLVLRSTALRFGMLRWTGRFPIAITMTVAAAGNASITTVEFGLWRLGQLRYVSTMREVGVTSAVSRRGDGEGR